MAPGATPTPAPTPLPTPFSTPSPSGGVNPVAPWPACPNLTTACPAATPFPTCSCDDRQALSTCYNQTFAAIPATCNMPNSCRGVLMGGACGSAASGGPLATPIPTPTPTPMPSPTPGPPGTYSCSVMQESCQGSSGSSCVFVPVSMSSTTDDTGKTKMVGGCPCCNHAPLLQCTQNWLSCVLN